MGILIKSILFLLCNEKALPWKGRPCVEKLQGVEPVGRWAGKAVNQKRKLCFDPCRCNCAQRLGYGACRSVKVIFFYLPVTSFNA